jgi:dipeptidase D
MGKEAIEGLKPQLLWQYFYGMTQVPRPSKKEEKIRAWVRDFASEHNFEFNEDATGNIVIKVPATEGMENAPTIVLQGHVDMVCEKNNDKVHDFENDPLTIYRDGDWITADGTTLGADNGIGVAAAMAIATDPNAKHGPLELLMTVDEETGMTGANGLEPGFITGKYLLNLDSEEDGAFYVGCSGGVDTEGNFEVEFDEIDSSKYTAFNAEITGLKGGHSGLDIHRGRGNAIKLLGYLLYRFGEVDHKLVSLKGGSLRNAIPREAEAVLYVNNMQIEKAKEIAADFEKHAKIEYLHKDAGLKVNFSEKSGESGKFMKDEYARTLVNTICGLPHGVISMSADLEDLVETSTNLATVSMNGNFVKVGTSQRSSVDFAKDNIAASVASIFNLAGAEVVYGDGYPGWQPDMDSKVLKVGKHVYETKFGAMPEIKAIHAGLECGLLGAKFPGTEMLSFGPTIEGAHSPDERVNIPAVEKFYDLLQNVLVELAAN